jgi:DNA-binding transcriptional regulator GbsR (MarR family)
MKQQQTPRGKVLWTLGSSGEMSISRLRQQTGLKKAGIDIVLRELARENRVIIRHLSVMLKR